MTPFLGPDPHLLCAVCRDHYDTGKIQRLSQLCRRCWDLVAPLLIERTDPDEPLLPAGRRL